MRLEKKLFEKFIIGIQEWLPDYYSFIMDNCSIDEAGYKLGYDKEPVYILDLIISNEEIEELINLANDLRFKATANKVFDEEVFEKYDRLVGFISMLQFYCKKTN